MDFKKYEMLETRPDADDFKTYYFYKKGKLVAKKVDGVCYDGYGQKIPDFDEIEYAVKEVYFDAVAFKNAKSKYIEKRNALNSMFEADMLDLLGLDETPKTIELLKLAYEYADANNKKAIYRCAKNLSILLL